MGRYCPKARSRYSCAVALGMDLEALPSLEQLEEQNTAVIELILQGDEVAAEDALLSVPSTARVSLLTGPFTCVFQLECSRGRVLELMSGCRTLPVMWCGHVNNCAFSSSCFVAAERRPLSPGTRQRFLIAKLEAENERLRDEVKTLRGTAWVAEFVVTVRRCWLVC